MGFVFGYVRPTLMVLNAEQGGEPMTTHGRSSSKGFQHRRLSPGCRKFNVSPISLSTMRSKLVPATMPFLLLVRLSFSLTLGGLKSSAAFPTSLAASPLVKQSRRTSSTGEIA